MHFRTIEINKWQLQIDEGEAATLGLAIQLQADWFLTGDTKARKFGEISGLEDHGSTGLLICGAAEMHIESKNNALHTLKRLTNSSLRLSEKNLYEDRKAINWLFLD